jgi:hypothetical protein
MRHFKILHKLTQPFTAFEKYVFILSGNSKITQKKKKEHHFIKVIKMICMVLKNK